MTYTCTSISQEPAIPPGQPSVVDVVAGVRRDRQLSVFAVGVGPSIRPTELSGISGVLQPDGSFSQQEDRSWFRSPDFARVSRLVNTIVTQVCQAVPTRPPGPPAGMIITDCNIPKTKRLNSTYV